MSIGQVNTYGNTYGWFGTEYTYALNITAPGFSMIENDFKVVLKCGNKSITLEKRDLVRDQEDNFYLCFDSSLLGPGAIYAIVTAYIPDPNFEDGFRTEVVKLNLIFIKRWDV